MFIISYHYRYPTIYMDHLVFFNYNSKYAYRPLVYERVYLPLCKVADTPFYIQGDDISSYVISIRI